MNLKIRIKYIFYYLLFNISGCLIAIKYRTCDDLINSAENKYTLLGFLSIGISYIGISIISLMISRDLIIKPDNFPFFSPYDFSINNNFLSSIIGVDNEKKFKKAYGVISSLLLVLTVTSYIILINKYEQQQLTEYGIIENVKVKEINYDIKHNPYAFFEYKKKKYEINFLANSLKVNDSVKIIYSNKNPCIVEYLKEYDGKQKN